MSVFNKNYLNEKPFFFLLLIFAGITLRDCSTIQRLTTKPQPEYLQSYTPKQPLSQVIETLSFNARISVESPDGDATISAQINYYQMDSITIRLKDPLRRQLATLTVTGNKYYLWLQRENRFLSGEKLPETVNDYQIPVISLDLIAELLIGQIGANNSLYQINYDKYKRPSRIDFREDNITVLYSDWNHIAPYYWLPNSLEMTTGQGLKFEIHYSQFQIELRKLS